jgi:malate dehydrogenase (oxaloacetate-decarboxylating)
MSLSRSGSDIILRVEIDKDKSTFGEIAAVIEQSGGEVIAIDVIRTQKTITVRDITAQLQDGKAAQLVESLEKLDGVRVLEVSDQTFLMHLGGKIEMQPKVPIKNRNDLSHVYTPHVAKICKAIEADESKAFNLTIKRNMIAVVSDGSAVLGLGNIGAQAALPVMEGKAMLFKQLAGVDAFPICLNTQSIDEIVAIVKALEPNFGGINLEDIAAPRCFEIEDRLKAELNIPVFHDDQHGTAAVLLAGLMNALTIVDKRLEDIRVVLCGIGAAGIACTKILLSAGVKNLIGVDRCGALSRDETYQQQSWQDYAAVTNPGCEKGNLSNVIRDADVFIGVSGPGVLTVDDLKSMARDSIVFTMANPEPEIAPELALPHVRVLATGRSDFPNQISNVLCFPGLFRGVLDCRASRVTEGMKLAAAKAIASVVREDEISESYIVPSVFNKAVAKSVSAAVIRAAVEDGVARKTMPEDIGDE